jgi:hypothetical protein
MHCNRYSWAEQLVTSCSSEADALAVRNSPVHVTQCGSAPSAPAGWGPRSRLRRQNSSSLAAGVPPGRPGSQLIWAITSSPTLRHLHPSVEQAHVLRPGVNPAASASGPVDRQPGPVRPAAPESTSPRRRRSCPRIGDAIVDARKAPVASDQHRDEVIGDAPRHWPDSRNPSSC